MAITLFFDKISIKLNEFEYLILGDVGTPNCIDLNGTIAKTTQVINYALKGITNAILDKRIDYRPYIEASLTERDGEDLTDFFYARNGNGSSITKTSYLKMIQNLDNMVTTYDSLMECGYHLTAGLGANETLIMTNEELIEYARKGAAIYLKNGKVSVLKLSKNINYLNDRYLLKFILEDKFTQYLVPSKRRNMAVLTHERNGARVFNTKAEINAKIRNLRTRFDDRYTFEIEKF